ncbi:hypothetical protein PINS_up002720 [Pythium insidiosum]|nr:hypothetical protein PINS_up002720 [Pythium insidiosum]
MKQKGGKIKAEKKSITSTSSKDSKESKPRKHRSPYVLFSIDKRLEVKESMGPGVRMIDVMARLSEVWKDMTDEERSPWVEAARQDRLRYEREMNEVE